jgi:hypothetical protein
LQVAGEAVEELRRYVGWKELGEEAPMRPLAPSSCPHDWREPRWRLTPKSIIIIHSRSPLPATCTKKGIGLKLWAVLLVFSQVA